jgi:hypothetical protein
VTVTVALAGDNMLERGSPGPWPPRRRRPWSPRRWWPRSGRPTWSC